MATGVSRTNLNRDIPLNVVLLGTTGTGKSTTGNTLLGAKTFDPSPNRESVTDECRVAEVDRFDRRLVVVDTPGILDTKMPEDDLKVILKECTHLACPGVHAFLFLIKIGDRDIGRRDKRTFDLLTTMFGKKFLDHTIVVFTAKECLGDDTLDQFVSGLPDQCKAFLNLCKGGYLAVSNVGTEKERAAKQVVDKVIDLVQENDGDYYKNILFDEENKKIQERMKCILQLNEDIKNNIKQVEREKQTLMASFKDHKPTLNQRKKLQEMENNISQLRKQLIDRKSARLKASTQLDFEKTLKNTFTRIAVVGGVVTAVATGGIAGVAVAGIAAGIFSGYLAGSSAGMAVHEFGKFFVNNMKSSR